MRIFTALRKGSIATFFAKSGLKTSEKITISEKMCPIHRTSSESGSPYSVLAPNICAHISVLLNKILYWHRTIEAVMAAEKEEVPIFSVLDIDIMIRRDKL